MAREIAIAGAASLAAIYNPRAEVIPMGAEFEEVQSVGMTESEVDVVQIAALIAWAGRETGDVRLAEIAIKHPRRHIEFCIREDGSICQSASFDPASGEVTRRYTHKGISDDSTWARAQAWGMLGWALAAQWTGDSSLLEPVERAAEWLARARAGGSGCLPGFRRSRDSEDESRHVGNRDRRGGHDQDCRANRVELETAQV
jgi:unsaturated chondroitin disaccharide hydrolase